MQSVAQIAGKLQLLALDVDGVLTDGRVIYTHGGDEAKTFDIKDGLGIKLLQAAGIEVVIITGRRSAMVDRRAAELGIEYVIQGREDKLTALNELLSHLKLSAEQVAYMGDDLPDLAAIQTAAMGCCPADAVEEVRHHAQWVATKPGGKGAVRELAEMLLRSRDQWETVTARYHR
jgi:3-deoxy-D-manno-octulosonate 8-phosphate phosphatase (KDO 8-P phosphatase)